MIKRKRQTRCNAIFKVDRATHLKMRDYTKNKLVEFGGNLKFNMKTKTLTPGTTSSGEYNGINVERGVVDWHSHPSQCKNDNTCALGLPSPSDLRNILLGAMHGTSAHLVFSKEGTYMIQVRAPLLRKLQNDDDENKTMLKSKLREIDDFFEDEHRRFVKTRTLYTIHMKKWMDSVRRYGFNIRLFKGDTIPEIRVYFDCHFLQKKTPFIPRVRVPAFTKT